MAPALQISYKAEWEDLLVGTLDGHTFNIELSMDDPHVFFPGETTWKRGAPKWAAGHWDPARKAAEQWCAENHIPMTVDNRAWIEFLRD